MPFVQVAMPTKEKSNELDPIERLAKGLDIAQSIYGITSDMSKVEELKKQSEFERQQKASQAAADAETRGLTNEKTKAETEKTRWDMTPEAQEARLKQKLAEAQAVAKINAAAQKDVAGYKAGLTPPKEPKPETSDQFKVATFGKRLEQAEADFQNVLSSGFNPSGIHPSSMLGDRFKDQKLKQYEQAKANFINASLRRESGAAIADEERTSADAQYFPLPGDGPDVLAQKKRNREQVLAGLRAEAGTAWDKIPSLKAESKKTDAGTGPHGPSVIQNGVKYDWNPKTKAYE